MHYLLNRYTLLRRIEGSNPSVSASPPSADVCPCRLASTRIPVYKGPSCDWRLYASAKVG